LNPPPAPGFLVRALDVAAQGVLGMYQINNVPLIQNRWQYFLAPPLYGVDYL
jgi:prephenate dehydratase